MTQDASSATWSPADSPYAIAVSEAWWWTRTASLCAQRIRDGRGPQQQIDTRLFIMALRELLYAADMEQRAIRHLDASVRKALGQARAKFDQAVPGLTDARNILVHFDEYAVGGGAQQRKPCNEHGVDPVDAAREFWPFGYDPATGRVRVGPYELDIEAATDQARQLHQNIYMAARAVDAAAEVGSLAKP